MFPLKFMLQLLRIIFCCLKTAINSQIKQSALFYFAWRLDANHSISDCMPECQLVSIFVYFNQLMKLKPLDFFLYLPVVCS